MFPILLVCQQKKLITQYIKQYIKKNAIASYDIFEFEPSPNVITIDQIREINQLFTHTHEKRLIIVYSFETTKGETQNAFLKTLEEKNAHAQFILITNSLGAILDTIISRCKVIRLHEVNETSETKISLELSEYSEATKEKVIKWLDQILIHLENKIKKEKSLKMTNNIKEIIKTRNLLIRNNLNPQLAIDHVITMLMSDS